MFLYTFTRYCVTTGARKKPIEYMFCFIYSQQCIIIISSRKMCGLIWPVFKKIISNNTIPTFQEVGGVTQPAYFVDGIRPSHGITLTITKVIDFYSQGNLPYCLPLFSIEMNQNVNS